MAVALPIFPLSSTVRASSVDTEQRLPYNRQCTYPKIPEALTSASPSTPAKKKAKISISDILNRNILKSATHDYFLDFDVGAISVGCSSMLAGTFCFPPLNIEEYNDRVMAVVRCEAQDAMLQKLMSDNFLSPEERFVVCLVSFLSPFT
ncbi:uncharacterized protein LOC125190837 isoform X2 [Salvia hispanica]|uniref:uncharacterized protein LOC125190837 isoform X2 n=1 Tax=Salvia hispanica TaxID=49212 RepID=UPI0020099338|nr:uncharacterized protein LOC125190837 isoform X2 [Salvia hispanica]